MMDIDGISASCMMRIHDPGMDDGGALPVPLDHQPLHHSVVMGSEIDEQVVLAQRVGARDEAGVRERPGGIHFEHLTKPLHGLEVDECAIERMERFMDVLTSFVAHLQSPEPCQPRQRALHHRAMPAQPLARPMPLRPV
jgi:hypothetical protein